MPTSRQRQIVIQPAPSSGSEMQLEQASVVLVPPPGVPPSVTVGQFLKASPQAAGIKVRHRASRARAPPRNATANASADVVPVASTSAGNPPRRVRQRRAPPAKAEPALTPQQEAEFKKYFGKLYHLRKTIHSMVYVSRHATNIWNTRTHSAKRCAG